MENRTGDRGGQEDEGPARAIADDEAEAERHQVSMDHSGCAPR